MNMSSSNACVHRNVNLEVSKPLNNIIFLSFEILCFWSTKRNTECFPQIPSFHGVILCGLLEASASGGARESGSGTGVGSVVDDDEAVSIRGLSNDKLNVLYGIPIFTYYNFISLFEYIHSNQGE